MKTVLRLKERIRRKIARNSSKRLMGKGSERRWMMHRAKKVQNGWIQKIVA